jgi:hypothetical protein
LCDHPIAAGRDARPVILPDPAQKGDVQMIAAPVCAACWALPVAIRYSRAMKLLRRMSGGKIAF